MAANKTPRIYPFLRNKSPGDKSMKSLVGHGPGGGLHAPHALGPSHTPVQLSALPRARMGAPGAHRAGTRVHARGQPRARL